MKLEKVQKVTETTQENVLTISESEFEEIAKDVITKTLKRDKESTDSPVILLTLTLSYSTLMSQLHSRLFNSKEAKNE